MAGLTAVRVGGWIMLGFATFGAAGCGSAPPVETQASRDAASAAGAQWTPDMKEKFKLAMKGHQKTSNGGTKGAPGPAK